MQKIRSTITIILLLLTLTGCSSTENTMKIQKAELTEKEQSILQLVGEKNTPYILDYITDNKVQSLHINTYELEGTEWNLISSDNEYKLNDSKGRIAFLFDNIGLGLAVSLQQGSAYRYEAKNDFNFEGLQTTTSYLSNPTTIEYEKEIPLVIQIHTSKNQIVSLSPEYGFYKPESYANTGHEKVYAITCLFK